MNRPSGGAFDKIVDYRSNHQRAPARGDAQTTSIGANHLGESGWLLGCRKQTGFPGRKHSPGLTSSRPEWVPAESCAALREYRVQTVPNAARTARRDRGPLWRGPASAAFPARGGGPRHYTHRGCCAVRDDGCPGRVCARCPNFRLWRLQTHHPPPGRLQKRIRRKHHGSGKAARLNGVAGGRPTKCSGTAHSNDGSPVRRRMRLSIDSSIGLGIRKAKIGGQINHGKRR